MPIYRCNKCGFVSEDTQTPVNTPTACGRCGTPSTVYGTVFFVEELIKRLASVTRELKTLQAQPVAAPDEVLKKYSWDKTAEFWLHEMEKYAKQ